MDFGDALAKECHRIGIMSSTQLANAIGTDPRGPICSQWEHGWKLPSLKMFARITALGVDPIPLLAAVDAELEKSPPKPPKYWRRKRKHELTNAAG